MMISAEQKRNKIVIFSSDYSNYSKA